MDDPEPDEPEVDSPSLPAGGYLYGIAFGTVFMTVGILIAWGLSKDLDSRWTKFLAEDGYGTAEQIRAVEKERAEYEPLIRAWNVREAARLEAAKATAPQADQGELKVAAEDLRAEAKDWEPRDPGDVPRLIPEGLWGRFVATSGRFALFKGLIVGPVFFMPGFFIALTMLLSLVGERSARRFARESPEKPWLHDVDWSQLRGRPHGSSSRAGILLMLCMLGWIDLWVTLLWALEPDPPGAFSFVMAVANFLTAIVAVLAVRRFVQGFKYGQPQLLLAQVPVEPGKTFSARLLVPRALATAEKLKATLRVERITTTGSGEKQRTHFVTLWKRALEVPRSAFVEQDGRLAAELRFEVPDDEPVTDATHQWRVAVDAETPGVDFEETFDVPVYRPA